MQRERTQQELVQNVQVSSPVGNLSDVSDPSEDALRKRADREAAEPGED